MASKEVHAFFEKVADNKALQAKLKTSNKKLKREAEEASAKATAKIAAAAGFKFTVKELMQASKAKAGKGTKMPEVAGQYYCPYGLSTGPGNYW